jgi:hypothetical protein
MLVRGLLTLLLWSVASSTQNVFVPVRGQPAAASTVAALKCAFRPSTPILAFSLQYEATHSMDFSIEKAGHPTRWNILFVSNLIKRMKTDVL